MGNQQETKKIKKTIKKNKIERKFIHFSKENKFFIYQYNKNNKLSN
jgi:hypothetical protein